MHAIRILKAEHDAALEALRRLTQALDDLEQDALVPTGRFTDIERFLRCTVDRDHQWKEEAAVFPHLRRCCGDGAGLVDRLEAEHSQARRAARAFSAAVADYDPADETSRARLGSAGRAYVAALRAVIAAETTELFPAMERVLADADQSVTDTLDFIAIQGWRLHGIPSTRARSRS